MDIKKFVCNLTKNIFYAVMYLLFLLNNLDSHKGL